MRIPRTLGDTPDLCPLLEAGAGAPPKPQEDGVTKGWGALDIREGGRPSPVSAPAPRQGEPGWSQAPRRPAQTSPGSEFVSLEASGVSLGPEGEGAPPAPRRVAQGCGLWGRHLFPGGEKSLR